MSGKVTRRTLIGAGLAVAAYSGGFSSGVFALTANNLNVDDLHTATYKLLGQRPANPFFARKIFAHIAETYPVDSLNALSAVVLATAESDIAQALAHAGLGDLASEIVNTWYSGTVFAGTDKERVIGYIDNLAWQAVKFSTPQSVCGGHFGHWYKIPTGQQL